MAASVSFLSRDNPVICRNAVVRICRIAESVGRHQPFWRITQHAGSQILPGISSHFLVATHVFLESIHYFVWILLIPLIDRRAIPWKLNEIPLFGSKNGFPKLVGLVLAVAVVIVISLWAGFSVDYTTTRDVYFAFAIAHVLAEFPFLIKML